MKRQEFVYRPAMVSDPSRHGRRRLLDGVEALVRRTKVINRAHHKHPEMRTIIWPREPRYASLLEGHYILHTEEPSTLAFYMGKPCRDKKNFLLTGPASGRWSMRRQPRWRQKKRAMNVL